MSLNKFNSKRIVFTLTILVSFQYSALTGQSKSDSLELKNIIAKVSGKEIYLDEFYRRSEYTVRPPYCLGNSTFEKMIILNSLIAEKLLALEAEKYALIEKNLSFKRYIQGRKEQAMRQLLFKKTAYDKAIIDSLQVWRIYDLAGRKYRLKFFNIEIKSIADSAMKYFRDTSRTFEQTFSDLTGGAPLPEKEFDYFDHSSKLVHDSLFSRKLFKNDVLGPISIDDTTNLILKVDGWTDSRILNAEGIKQRYSDVEEKMMDKLSGELYNQFMSSLMRGKRIDFNRDIFIRLVNALGPMYLQNAKNKQDMFLHGEFGKAPETKGMEENSGMIEDILNDPLFEIDGEIFTVGEFEKYLDIHPLVFRKKKLNKGEFAHQLKLAIIDAVRDKYITDEAYKQNFDKTPTVIHYGEMFQDAVESMYMKNRFILENNLSSKDQLKLIDNELSDYIKELQKKYSDKIEININLFNKIELTKTPMFVTQEGVPFPIVVPSFPLLTSKQNLDYGRKMGE